MTRTGKPQSNALLNKAPETSTPFHFSCTSRSKSEYGLKMNQRGDEGRAVCASFNTTSLDEYFEIELQAPPKLAYLEVV